MSEAEQDLDPGGDPPADDRNDERAGSPIPDPTDETADVEDDPGAD